MTERRWDPTSEEWRTFATHRQDRTFLPPTDACPLCPTRPGGPQTELPRPGFQVAVFDNRFPSLSQLPPVPSVTGGPLSPVAPAEGATEVVVYSDRHDVTLADLPVPHIARLVDVWADRYAELGSRSEVDYVFVFENKGEAIGVTLHHPHGQIYGYPDIPPRALHKLQAATRYLQRNGCCVWCDVVARERADALRVVAANQHWLAYVPFAARFPYEVHLTTQRHATSLLDLTDPERWSLADLLRTVVRAYDELFGFSLPYVMGMHQAPVDDGPWLPVSHLHLELTPLHRTADRLKYLAGSELAAGAFINDTAPESTAAALRAAVQAGQQVQA
ncbi:MAG TPA: galactose-1-phosphate uridylyltransferase [Mycobacteriales bacterium]|nr:galactose-1-phosphate uridylyltransferase [Mycobacteriales bacterium]